MLSKGLIKLVNSLDNKKYRQIHKLFIAEGTKLVNDLIKLEAPIKTIISTSNIERCNQSIEYIQCNSWELEKISFLKTSPEIIALVDIIENDFNINDLPGKLSIGLDSIQDPGNMGTIIRLANWFGIENILCSNDCVDNYNPKVVQASMGALIRVKVHYIDLPDTINELIKFPDYQINGTFMNGECIYSSNLQSNGLIVMGNEGKGISEMVERLVTKRISIPTFSDKFNGAESLNVGVATGIIISEFTRQININNPRK